jgi:hypothetical protein
MPCRPYHLDLECNRVELGMQMFMFWSYLGRILLIMILKLSSGLGNRCS